MVGKRPTENPEVTIKARETTNLSEKAQQVNTVCMAEITPGLRESGAMEDCNKIMSGKVVEGDPQFNETITKIEQQRTNILNSVDQNNFYPE